MGMEREKKPAKCKGTDAWKAAWRGGTGISLYVKILSSIKGTGVQRE